MAVARQLMLMNTDTWQIPDRWFSEWYGTDSRPMDVVGSG